MHVPAMFMYNLFVACHKILGPSLEWGPMGPHIINIMGPHRDFGAPFELVLLARQEVVFGTAIPCNHVRICQT